MNPFETAQETAERLGIDPNAQRVTQEQMTAFLTERDKVEAAKREAEAAALIPPPPPPSSDDLLEQTRARAAALREEAEIRSDLSAVLLADRPDLALSKAEIAGMTLAEMRQAAGIDPTDAQIEADLATDYAANLAAANAPTEQFGSDAYRERLAASIAETDSKMGEDA